MDKLTLLYLTLFYDVRHVYETTFEISDNEHQLVARYDAQTNEFDTTSYQFLFKINDANQINKTFQTIKDLQKQYQKFVKQIMRKINVSEKTKKREVLKNIDTVINKLGVLCNTL